LIVIEEGAAGGQTIELGPQVILRGAGAAVEGDNDRIDVADPAREQLDIRSGDEAAALSQFARPPSRTRCFIT
jgi:hypothetical protein